MTENQDAASDAEDDLVEPDEDLDDLGDDDSPLGGDNPRRLLALLATLAIVVVVLIAIFADRGGDDPPEPTAVPTQEVAGTGGQAADGQGDVVELGSLSVTAYQCPEMASPDTDCLEAGTVELSNATIVLQDGEVIGIDAATSMPDGSLAWLNVPVGAYTLLEEGLMGPPDLILRNVIGAVAPVEEGWTVTNLDPNQPAVVQILFTPDVGSPAAG